MLQKENFEKVLLDINRQNTNCLLDWIRKHYFYSVPASANKHNAEQGGLLKHSLEVCNEAFALRKEWIDADASLAQYLPKESVAIAALLHDLCKWNVYYVSPYDKKIKCNKDAKEEGHGMKSVMIIKDCGFELTHEEELAIWWHMGYKHEPSFESHKADYAESENIPLCRLIRNADYNATHLKERFENAIRGLNGYDTSRLIKYLEGSNFYSTHSGSHHHYSTGLVAHSLGTWRHMMKIAGCLDANEAAAVALLHDIAMQNRSRKYTRHGSRSANILDERLNFGLSIEALNAIRFHKKHYNPGAFEQKVHKTEIWKKLYESDHFDADHDITDVYKHYVDEIF